MTYREAELSARHPLRIVLGELATASDVARLTIDPLSRAAVGELARPRGVDPDELFRRTGGNPFFVTEVLATGADEIPRTVRDAVLARAARLSDPARRLLEAVAVAPPHAEVRLLEAIAGDVVGNLEECLGAGMLEAGRDGVAFRHELARLTIHESLAPDRAVALHRAALRALADPRWRPIDLDIGPIRARRGDPEQWPPLDDALALVEASGELQRLAPIAAARAEAAWLAGEPDKIGPATDAAFDLALERNAGWLVGELAFWGWRAGLLDQPPPAAAEPYARQIRGDWRGAEALWAGIGCPARRPWSAERAAEGNEAEPSRADHARARGAGAGRAGQRQR